MKKLRVVVCLAALGAMIGFACLTPLPVHAHSATVIAQPSATSPGGDAKDAKTFAGRISQMDGKYVLGDTADKATFQLDDQEKAKQFDGQDVKVTGTLDTATNTIHVVDIEAA